MDQFEYIDEVETEIYKYYPPLAPIRGIVSIPHSGLTIPDEFRQYLNPEATVLDLNEDVDYAVDELVDINTLQNAGIGVVVAKIHRICIDLNRSPDIAVFSWVKNTQGVEIITKIDQVTDEIRQKWIQRYHLPYFNFLDQIIFNIQKIKLGFVSLLDLHSMPSKPTSYHLAKNPNQSTERRKDFCLSDLNGLSCQKAYIEGYRDAILTESCHDYKISLNDPYFGGYVTQYMDKTYTCNVIQCEINRDIYMDEIKKVLIQEKVDELKPILTKAIVNVNIAFNTPFVVQQMGLITNDEESNYNDQFAFTF